MSDNSIVNIWKGGNAYQEYLEEQKEKEFTYNLYHNTGAKWKALRAVYNIGTAANEALNWTLWLLTQPEVKNALYVGLDFYSWMGGGFPGGWSSQEAVALGKIQGIIVPNVSSNSALSIEDMLSRRVHFIARPGKNETTEEFEMRISKLRTEERVAAVKEKAREAANKKGLIKDSKLSKKNNRDIYRDPTTGEYYSVDTQHGRFEHLNKRGHKR